MQPKLQNYTLSQQNNKNNFEMAKILRVTDSFLFMEIGDTFEYNNDTKMYVAEHNEEFHKSDDSDSELRSTYSSNFAISEEYAKELIKDGYLEEVVEDQKDTKFINVFDEINKLHAKYTDELANLEEDMSSMPQCMKVERSTVLTNMITLLTYLKSLKK